MNQVVNELKALHLETLDEDWIQNAYYSEFLEFGNFSQEYENVLESLDIRAVFRSIIKSIDNWLNPQTVTGEEKSWSSLSPHVNHQALLALVAYYIDCGSKNVLTEEYRSTALLASRLYYKLLSISGYKAYHIYHSQLFAHSLTCLGFPKVMCDNENKYFHSKELTQEVNSVIKHLRLFVLDLRTIIKNLLLSPSDMNFEEILSNLVDITGGAIANKFNIDQIELAHISTVIYDMINILICGSTGEPNTLAIRWLFKSILPKLIAASSDCRNNNNVVRASYVTYSGLLLSRYGKAALPGYTVLLQHLCYNPEGLERAEVRSARVSLVVGLMSLLPRKSYRNTVKWLLKLSTTAKVMHRHIAMEMLCKLLENDPEQANLNDETLNILQPVATMSLNGQPCPNQQPNDTPAVENEDNPTTANDADQSETERSKSAQTTDDDSSQDLPPESNAEDVTEEDVAGLLRQRAQTAPHVAIVRALYERAADAASSIRARALTAFADCLAARRAPTMQAIKELNGEGEVSRLMAVAARCVSDERAVVRRAAVVLLHRLLSDPDTPALSPNDLGILVGICRDASILVRSTAVTVMGELITQRPLIQVFDAFLTGPMHQLSDPETKIQEQVVSLIKQVLIERLQKYNENGCEDPLPWMFLAGVVRHNMRRHLQKACTLLAKSNNCINHRVIDILSTHLGVKDDGRNLQCLVLLTSVARHVEYSDVAFVFDYYYKLTEDSQCRDVRLLPLTLELMTEWSRWASAPARQALRDHLIGRLITATDDACRTSCAMLAAHLDPHNLQWATELMQISERRALNGGSLEEWVRAADLSLVALEPPASELLALFLHALAHPPPEWSDAQRGTAVVGAGRLCVRSRQAAAATAPLLAALLGGSDAPLSARINALLALTDICIRYTCIVEPLLGTVCACVSRDTEPPLRRAAARALTRLLLGGYLRLRIPLYYRYCALLADEEHEVREPAEYYVTSCLTPATIFHHFVDCVLHYNSEETESISFDARQLIYDVMLQRLSIVQRMNVQCRLAQEVLQHAADVSDEGEDLPPTLNAALLDTITVLCGPRMKLPKKPQNPGQQDDIVDLQERVTTNIVTHKMKRMVAEVVVPAVLRLYARLRASGGQLAAYLVRLATDMLNDYRQEIEELIDNDAELVVRIQQFQETIGLERSFGNTRNLVTSSAPPEPETPQTPAPRRRRGDQVQYSAATKRRALRM